MRKRAKWRRGHRRWTSKTLVPFTYSFMPTARYLKELIDGGYLGAPYHLNMRYYTGFARDGDYLWRFDRKIAGSGIIGDLGSHFLYIAEWLYGDIERDHLPSGIYSPASAGRSRWQSLPGAR